MSGYMDYRFTATAVAAEGIREQLGKFRQTLDAFAASYRTLARSWGGTASANAENRAKEIDALGTETAAIVNKFLQAYEGHLFAAKNAEARIAGDLA